jgi:hypothetical protein
METPESNSRPFPLPQCVKSLRLRQLGTNRRESITASYERKRVLLH